MEWTSYDDLSTNVTRRIIESRTYLKLNGNWGLRSIAMYEYDAQEKVTKMLRCNNNKALTLTQTLIYDARGHVVTVREQSSVASPDLAVELPTMSMTTDPIPTSTRSIMLQLFFLVATTS